MSKPVSDRTRKKSSEVNKARGTGSKSRYLCAFGKLSWRIALFHVLRSFPDIRKKQLCKIIVIHRLYLLEKIKNLVFPRDRDISFCP